MNTVYEKMDYLTQRRISAIENQVRDLEDEIRYLTKLIRQVLHDTEKEYLAYIDRYE